MMFVRMLRVVLHTLLPSLIILVLGTSSQAESYLSDLSVSFGHHLPDERDAVFYRAWADPERNAPRALGAGQWTLETDRKTRLAYPRLVALTNGASIAAANAALEAMHGRILKTAYQTNSDLTGTPFGELDMRFGDFAVELSTVKLTYLTSRTLSLVAIGDEALGGNGSVALVRGAVVDISSGAIFTINACHEELSRPFFTFGTLLTVCDDRKLEAFRELWREQGRIAQSQVPVVPKSMLPKNVITQEDCRPLALAYINEMSRFSLYLTPAGLAVHDSFAVGAWEGECVTDPRSPFFPIVIPWHKLAPLMNRGQLRDELLALH
ncbi:MAG TPA: hypothetical protein VKY24_21530 [Reyranella sp.]|jgi:hypothetical protein|nr:hypothetical protein [Reyranella sp.]